MNDSDKTAPWWATLLAILLTAAVSVTGTMWALRGGPSVPTAPSVGTSIITDTLTYVPHILLLFGVLADMFTYEGVYSIPSLVGLISIPVSYLFAYVWQGIATLLLKTSLFFTSSGSPPAPPMKTGGGDGSGMGPMGAPDKYFEGYNGCYVQGFEGLASNFSPQTLVVSATVLCYYIFDLVKNRGWVNATAAIVLGGVLYLGQTYAVGTCKGISPWKGSIRALAEGAFVGGVAFSAVDIYYPNRLPSAVISNTKTPNKNRLSAGADGKLYDPDGKRYVMVDGAPVLDTCGGANGGTTTDGTSTGGSGTAAASSSCPN
jgi:hypothetical protein